MSVFSVVRGIFNRKGNASNKAVAAKIYFKPEYGTPLLDIEQVLAPHKKLIEHTARVSGFAGDRSEYNFDTLFAKVIENYVSYIHLLPASSGWHHARAGGLTTHSLEVANRALRLARQSHLPSNKMIDIEVLRKPRWDYATWLAGLLHDSGKVFSDMDVVCAEDNNKKWHPLVCDLYTWAENENVDRYFVKWKKNRKHKAHENTSLSLLQTILTPEAKMFISECPDDLHSALSSCLTGYSHNDGYMQDAVRRADSISTAMDIKKIWDKDLGPREAELFEQVIMAMKDMADEWLSDNKTKVLNDELFIEWPSCVDDVITKLSTVKTSNLTATMLLSNLVERGIVRGIDNEKYAQFYEGVTSSKDCLDILSENTKKDFVNYIRIEWPYHVLDCRPIPSNNYGLLKTDQQGNSLIFTSNETFTITALDVIEYKKELEQSKQKPEPKIIKENTPAKGKKQKNNPKSNPGTDAKSQPAIEQNNKIVPAVEKKAKVNNKPEKDMTFSFLPNSAVTKDIDSGSMFDDNELNLGKSDDEVDAENLLLSLNDNEGAIMLVEDTYFIIESVALEIWTESKWALLNEHEFLSIYHLDELNIISKNRINGKMVRSVAINKSKYLELVSASPEVPLEANEDNTEQNNDSLTDIAPLDLINEPLADVVIENDNETALGDTTATMPIIKENPNDNIENAMSDEADANETYESEMTFNGIQYLELEISKKLSLDSKDVEFEDVKFFINKCFKHGVAVRDKEQITIRYSKAAELIEVDNERMKNVFILLPKLGKWENKTQTIILG
jgi:hypothetical protein